MEEFASVTDSGTPRVSENGSMWPSASSIDESHGRGHSLKCLEGILTLVLRSNTELHASYGSSPSDGLSKKRKQTRETLGTQT